MWKGQSGPMNCLLLAYQKSAEVFYILLKLFLPRHKSRRRAWPVDFDEIIREVLPEVSNPLSLSLWCSFLISRDLYLFLSPPSRLSLHAFLFRALAEEEGVWLREGSMSTPARKRLMRDFKRLQQDPPAGISGAPQDNNIMLWNAVIFG